MADRIEDTVVTSASGNSARQTYLPSADTLHAPPSGSLAGVSLGEPHTPQPLASQGQPQGQGQTNIFLRLAKRRDVIFILLLAIGAVTFFVLYGNRGGSDGENAALSPSSRYGTITLPLEELAHDKNITLSGPSNVAINGALQANDTFTIAPSVQPIGAKPGQIYYDEGTNQLAYYNGQGFVFLTAQQQGVQSLGGASGDLGLGNGLALTAGQLSNAGVLSLQGQNGAVTLTPGNGIGISGTTISNTGVTSVASGSSNIVVTTGANGTVTVSSTAAGTGTVSSPGGSAGTIPMFTGAQTIANSLLTQSGATITVGGNAAVTGNLSVAGTVSLNTPLSVSSGGTGASSLTLNGVVVGQGAGALTAVTGNPGECLRATAGAPAFQACPGGGGGVSSLNTLSGDLVVQGTANQIMVNDNGTDTITLSTPQDIAATSSPTFAGVTTTGDIAVNGGDITSSAATLNINAGSTIALQDSTTVGGTINVTGAATLQSTLAVQGASVAVGGAGLAGSLVLNDGTGSTVTLQTAALGASRVYTFPDAGGNADVCLSTGNCLGGAGGAPASAEYLVLTLNGSLTNERALLLGGNLSATDGGANGNYTLNTVQNPTFATSVTTPIIQNAGLTLSATGANNLLLQTGGSTRLTVGSTGDLTATGDMTVQGGAVTLGVANSQAGTLALADGGSNFTGTIQVATPLGSNRTYTLPDASGVICLDTGNCIGGPGGSVGGSGTNNTLAKFTSTGSTIGNSSITDDGSTVAINGDVDLVVQGSSITVGVGGPAGRTGSIVLNNSTNANTVALQSGVTSASYALTLPTAVGAANQCLKAQDGTGSLFWDDCLGGGGGGGITSINSQTGSAITINNASGAGNAITIDNAAADGATKGIAAFNNINFSAAGGVINTIQGISTAAAPQFAGLTLTGNLNLGTNTLQGTTAAISFTNFSVAGDGNTTVGGTLDVSGAATLQSTLAVQGASVTVGGAAQAGSVILNDGSGSTLTLQTAALGANRVYTFPEAGGNATVCLNTGNCLGGGGGGANTALSNLAGVAINTTLLPGAAGTIHLGSAALPFGDVFLAGTSGIPGTNNFRITGASTSGLRTITLPDATGTVCLQGSAACGFATGTGAAFVQNGNSFGGPATLGTNENFDLGLETRGTTWLTIEGALQADSASRVVLANNTDFIMQGSTAQISNPLGQAGSQAFGLGITMGGSQATAFGDSVVACTRSVAIGYTARTDNGGSCTGLEGAVGIGHGVITNEGSVAIGGSEDRATGIGINGVAVGSGAQGGNGSIAIGRLSTATTASTIAIGQSATTQASGAIAIGPSATVSNTHTNSIAIGSSAASTASGQLVIGSAASPLTSGFLGSGVIGTSGVAPSAFTLNATGGNGTNIQGAALNIAGGRGTGNANGGNITFQITVPGTSGTALRTLNTVGTFSGTNGSFTLQNAANSNAAFRVLNQAGTIAVLSVNTSTPGITINGAGTDANGGIITFGTGTSAPTISRMANADVPWFGDDVLAFSVAGMQIHSVADDPLTDPALFQMDGYNGRFTFRNGSDDFGFLRYVDTADNVLFGVNDVNGDGEATFQNNTDSDIAFRILKAGSGIPLFQVDTSNNRVYIGNPTADSTGALLVLDTKDASGDPTGVNGAMYYNDALGVFRCYENDYWRDCMQNARTSYNYTNELLTRFDDNVLHLFGTTSQQAATTGHPGIVQFSVSTQGSDAGIENFGNSGETNTNILLGNGDYWRYETVTRIPTLSSGAERFTYRTGFNDDTSNAADGQDGCYFRYSDNINGGKWQAVCRSAGTESTCDTASISGSTVSANTWYRLTVAVNSAGNSADFQVNGSTTNGSGRCQVTTNIPTGPGRQTTFMGTLIKDLNNAARTVDIDYLSVEGQFGTPR